ncbi:Na(+)/H(+) exchange regulatory cofactor NHE-RF1 [Chelonus insularis]|uniref:Na(+)/H(+) exchange regulatory cofactor NHE-RF1 n=1 Tax=Chelonus insularis TaxID=460826 RepID=UPI00158ACE05|nr:Na(+)/H(+) exchange regulatory cofactor NHE-RF1 [Chelonus insularis]
MSMRSDNVPCARLCHIVKWDDFDGYGFNLHAERGKNGQFIGKVDDGSPSQAAGLRQGDRIIEVNEINIANETHKQVVDRIKAFPNETKLLVVDQEADEYYKANNIVIRGTMTGIKVIKTPERNPATVENETRSDGSISSVDDNIPKSIGSNDTSSNSGSTTAAMTMNEEKVKENETQENGRNNSNNSESNVNATKERLNEHLGTENGNVSTGKETSLNLKMSAKELRAQLAARKKYDPKKESIGFKDKFDIVQKL